MRTLHLEYPFFDAILVFGAEVLFAAFDIRLHCFFARPPASGTNLAMLVGELESLNQSQGLVHIPTNGQVVDSHLPQVTFVIDDEKTTESDSLIFFEHTIGTGYFTGLVSEKRDLHVTEAALLTRSVHPG